MHRIGSRAPKTLFACTVAIAVWLAAGHPSLVAAKETFPLETCLWLGPVEINLRPDLNYGFPDTHAVYWQSRITLPAGARLDLVSQYAHGRYQSVNSYDAANGTPTDAIHDVNIVPDPGSENPFLPGARRTVNRRDFTVSVVNQPPPADPAAREPNTLYAAVSSQAGEVLIYRVYVADKNRDLTGGVGLPDPRLTLASGEVLEGDAACAALSVVNQPLPKLVLPPAQYAALRDQPGEPPIPGPGSPGLPPFVQHPDRHRVHL